MSLYICVIHAPVKKYRNSAHTLLWCHNLYRCVTAFILIYILMGWFYVAHLQPVCYDVLLAVLQGLMFTDEFGVCILAHIAAIMYYSSKLQNEIPRLRSCSNIIPLMCSACMVCLMPSLSGMMSPLVNTDVYYYCQMDFALA